MMNITWIYTVFRYMCFRYDVDDVDMCLVRRGEVSLLLELEEQSPVLYMEQSAGCRQLRLVTQHLQEVTSNRLENEVFAVFIWFLMHIIFNFNHLF